MYAFDFFTSLTSVIKHTSIIEWLIFITAMAYVILAIFENVWCWLFGIISSALTIALCVQGKLFLESGLQIFYVILGGYGWYQWLFGSEGKKELIIMQTSAIKIIYLIITGLIIWLPFGYFAHRYSTQVMPYLDAFITAFSLVATWMTAKKIIQNWLFWIVIDALAVLLYSYRDYYLIGLLYIIYTVLALAGYIKWRNLRTKLSV